MTRLYNSNINSMTLPALDDMKRKHENGGILKYQNPATTLDLPEGSEYEGELKPAVIKPKPYLGILNTYYPIISEYPFTGHSELDLYDSDGVFVNHISKYGDNYDYNLVTNNCSDATRRAVEKIFGEKINPYLFTTPGDVQDFVVEKTGQKPAKEGAGQTSLEFNIPFATAMDLKNQNLDFYIQDYLYKARKIKKQMKEENPNGNSDSFDLSTSEVIQRYEDQKYKFQPFKNKKGGSIHIKKKNRGKFTDYCGGKVTEECIAKGKKSKDPKIRKRATFAANARKWKHENGGILKAQNGTPGLPGGVPSYMQVQPLSPVGIALNQAKASAKMKGEQQYLPPGVKEVVGPDGKKVAIRIEQPLQPLEQNIAEGLPGTGDVAEVGYIANDVKSGNYGTAALGAGLMFIPGNAGKLLSKYRKTVSKTADAVEDAVRKADVSEYINTVDDALPERQPLTISKSKQFGNGTSESKLTDAEKAGIPKGERNQPIKVKTHNEKQITPLLSAKYIQRFEAPPLDPDYPEISNLQRAKYRRLMDKKFENIFDNTEGFNKTLQSYIDGLPNEIDPRFTSITDGEIIQPSIAVRGYRNYLLNNGVDAADISDDDLARLLTQEYKNLSNTATGKLKNILLGHGSPTQFDSFDFSKTSANTGNSGALGPGNYFSTHGGRYGHTRNKSDYSLEMNNFQPYIVSNITSTPAGHDMVEKGLLPKFIDSYAMRSANNQAILQKWISEIPTNDNRAYIDFTEAVNGYFDGPSAGIMIRRNTGIKSLYPHPSRFIRNADGTVTLIPTDGNDARVNFKQGGKL